jgi:hypothetical protein
MLVPLRTNFFFVPCLARLTHLAEQSSLKKFESKTKNKYNDMLVQEEARKKRHEKKKRKFADAGLSDEVRAPTFWCLIVVE